MNIATHPIVGFLLGALIALVAAAAGALIIAEYKRRRGPVDPDKKHWPALAVLPSTNWQIWVASWLGVSTVITVNLMMLLQINIQEEVLYPTFGFITTLGGIGAYQFKKKRETSSEHFEGVAKVEAAKAPPPAPAPPPANVTNVRAENVEQVNPPASTALEGK